MTEYLIKLPWPPKELAANSRKDRRHTTKQRAAYKHQCWAACKALGAQIASDAHLHITFHEPTRHRRDLDNMLSGIKYGLDGIALAAGVDDYGWSLSLDRGEIIKGGSVMVHVKPPAGKVELRGVVGCK